MRGKWEEVTIGALLARDGGSIKTGPFGTALKAKEYSATGVPLISVGEVGYGSLQVHEKTPRVPQAVVDRLPEYVLESGDIVFGRKGAVDRCALVKPYQAGWFLGSDGIRLRLPETVDPRFIAFQLQSPGTRAWLVQHATGTTMPSLNQAIIERIPLRIPPLHQQRAIAQVLGTLDDKIQLNRRMSETLEEMARALFESWFVRFDPVRAKMEGRDPGLPSDLADLFPDRLVDSDLGEIPEGWQAATLADHFDATKGVSYKGSQLGDGVPLHNLNSIYEGGGYKYEGIKFYSGEYSERHAVRPGDVIVANTEQGHDRLLIGYAALVPAAFGNDGVASHHIYRMRPRRNSPLTAPYLCHLLNSRWMHDIVSGYANGTTVNMLPIDGVQKPLIVVPPAALVSAFDSFAMNAERKRELAHVQSRTLAALRDTLLPKLISGELRVKDAERLVAAAT